MSREAAEFDAEFEEINPVPQIEKLYDHYINIYGNGLNYQCFLTLKITSKNSAEMDLTAIGEFLEANGFLYATSLDKTINLMASGIVRKSSAGKDYMAYGIVWANNAVNVTYKYTSDAYVTMPIDETIFDMSLSITDTVVEL